MVIGDRKMWSWLKSVKNGFRRRFKWYEKQPAEIAAEGYFKEMGWSFERYGWERARIGTRGLPNKLRFMPDYVVNRRTHYAFYEAKGMSSRGGVMRIKVVVHETLAKHYVDDLELRLFIYALPSEDFYDVPFSVLCSSSATVEEAHDGAVFFVFPLSVFEEYLVVDG